MSAHIQGFMTSWSDTKPAIYQPLDRVISLLSDHDRTELYAQALPTRHNILTRIRHIFDELAVNVNLYQGFIYGQVVANLIDVPSQRPDILPDATHIDIFIPKPNLSKFFKSIEALNPTPGNLAWVDTRNYLVYTIKAGSCSIPLVITTENLKVSYYNHLLSWDGKMVRLILDQAMLDTTFDFYSTIDAIRWLNRKGYLVRIDISGDAMLEGYFIENGLKLLM